MSLIEIRDRSGVLFCIDKKRFEKSLRYTISYDTNPYNNIICSGSSSLSGLKGLFKKAQVPYPVLFMSDSDFERSIEEYMHKTFSGINKDRTYSIATKGDVDISQVSILLKHIASLQYYISASLKKNNLVGNFLKHKNKPPSELANMAREMIGFDLDEFYSIRRKDDAFKYLETKLNLKSVFVSVYDHRLCAQVINIKEFAGIFVNHKKSPYLFVRSSDDKSSVELWGRRTLTTVLLFWFLLNKINKPVLISTNHRSDIDDKSYLFAEEFLMPQKHFINESIASYEDVKNISSKYKVSPSAIIMRASRLCMINGDSKRMFFEQRDADFEKYRADQGYGKNAVIEKSIVKNVGSRATEIILNQFSNNLIDESIAKKLLSPRKGARLDFDEIRKYAQ